MSSSPNAPTAVQSAHAIHLVDDSEACFDILAPSSKDIRSIRSHIVQAVCSTCMISEKDLSDLGQQLRTCGKVWTFLCDGHVAYLVFLAVSHCVVLFKRGTGVISAEIGPVAHRGHCTVLVSDSELVEPVSRPCSH
jgi:hypothetical protein